MAGAASTSACQRAPDIDILGSFFPIWLVCIVIGIMLTVIARMIFLRIDIESEIGPRLLVYPSMALLIAFSTWLIFFR
ncbi:MAG: hypothetical protein JOY54_08700 [Acidobacteriaceae bacterium]|nr:hypothetical protein [Acidobacteriaceae bacterium]